MTTEKKIEIADLLLDPNNPRFMPSLKENVHVKDDEVEKHQSKILPKFMVDDTQGDGENVFSVKELCDSMRSIGFVPIDRVVVREIKGSEKYLVIEGNRRIASAKLLLKKDEIEKNPRKRLRQDVVETLKLIEALVIENTGAPDFDLDHHVSVILGLRHYGSVLEWKPLSKAYNTYTEYMGIKPKLQEFKFDNKRATDVARRFSIRPVDVKNACMTYIIYTQLCEAFDGVNPHHYSLIEAAVTNRTLTGGGGYFVVDALSHKMDEPSLSKMNDLCQFEQRDTPNFVKLINDPKNIRDLAKLVKESNTNESESVRSNAKGLLTEVEAANCDVEKAADRLTNFINQKKWAEALTRLLDKQENDLKVEDFKPIGNALVHINEVKATFSKLRRVMDI